MQVGVAAALLQASEVVDGAAEAGQHPPLCCVLPQAVLSLTGYRMPDPLLTFSSAAAYPNASLSLPGGFGRAVGTPPCFEARRMVFQRDLRDVKV